MAAHKLLSLKNCDEKFNKDYFQNILPFDRSRFSKYEYAIKKLSLMNLTD